MKKRYTACLLLAMLAGALPGYGARETAASSEEISQQTEAEPSQEETDSGAAPIVYMTTDISSDELMAVYEALGAELPDENVAVKISTGEKGSNYLRPELIQELVQEVNGKNISIGIASSDGKAHIHSGGTGGSMWGGDQDAFLESMAEAGKSVSDYMAGNMLYINVMNRLSVDCDCTGSPAEPDMHDIGILASFDPVALDQACIDLVYSAEDGESLIQRIESRNGLLTLEHAEEIGLGSRTYDLVSLDG